MYEDLQGLISHLDTFAQAATKSYALEEKRISSFKSIGQYLGISFTRSNPMKLIKRSEKPLGNLPLEILSYLASYIDDLIISAQLGTTAIQTLALNDLRSLNDALVGTERIRRTPLPIAYGIAISQITWVYIIMLPFQLDSTLKWIMIPATIISAYIILGILFIGREIEDPFGNDVNDL
jgi:putative membrane protein